ncbi:hypothetical protein MHU86_18403 [Fragilaria crotonensis]|nr:hypothetical protein MHU86_18403 [Fragilaria crotonensis]
MTTRLALQLMLVLLANIAHANYRVDAHVAGLGRPRGRLLQPTSRNNDDVNGNTNDDMNGNTNDDRNGNNNDDINRNSNDDMNGNDLSQPPSAAPLASQHTSPVKATLQSQSPAPNSTAMVVVVDLLGFVVLVDNSTFQDLASAFEELLTDGLKKDFDSLISVDLRLETQMISGKTRQSQLVFSGTATFDSAVSDQRIRDAQTLVLQDSEAVRQVAPDVITVTMSNPVPEKSSTSTASQNNNSALIAILVVGVVVALGVATFFGYRYFCLSPGLSRSPLRRSKGHGTRHLPIVTMPRPKYFQEPVLQQEMAPPEQVLRSNSIITNDEYSLDGISTTAADSEAGGGVDTTEAYLAKRLQEKERQLAALSSGQKKDSESFDDTDAGFTYDNIGRKSIVESEDDDDDDVYTAGAERSADLEAGTERNAAYAADHVDQFESAFDEFSLDRPFDESTLPGDDEQVSNHNEKFVDEGDKHIGAGKSSAKTARNAVSYEGVSLFLQGRRKATRVAHDDQERHPGDVAPATSVEV